MSDTRRIVGYAFVTATSSNTSDGIPEQLRDIPNMVDRGWQPLGPMVVTPWAQGALQFSQTLVRYED